DAPRWNASFYPSRIVFAYVCAGEPTVPGCPQDKMPRLMELYQLRSFAAIAETGQLTRAAEKLHVSQPALSAQLKALEEELEFSLFERTPNGMVLTAAGKRLLAGAEHVLAAAQTLHNDARAMRGEIAGKASI